MTTAIPYTAGEHIAPAASEILAEIRAGRPIPELAEELADSYASDTADEEEGSFTPLSAGDFERALLQLRADDYKAAAEAGAEDGAEHAEDLASGPTGEAASAEALRACASPGNDWGTSSSEAWSLTGGAKKFGADARESYCEAYEKAARVRCGELAEEATATTLDLAMEFARQEGAGWAVELLAKMDDDDRASWIASAQRDPRGWWEKCAFDTVRDRVSAALWAKYKQELSEACADACAEAIEA